MTFNASIYDIYNLIRVYVKKQPFLVQKAYDFKIPTMQQIQGMLRMFPADFNNTSMQYMGEEWEMTMPACVDQIQHCGLMRAFYPSNPTRWTEPQYQNLLYKEIRAVLAFNNKAMPGIHICQAVMHKFWLHPAVLSELGLPIPPTSSQILEALNSMPDLYSFRDNSMPQQWDRIPASD